MTDWLSKLEDVVMGRTSGPWVLKPDGTRDVLATVVFTHVPAGGFNHRPNAAFVALMGTCADELLAVVKAAEAFFGNESCTCSPNEHCMPCDRNRKAALKALSALHAKLEAL